MTMKKFLFLFLLFSFFTRTFAQISEGGMPPSFSWFTTMKSAQAIPEMTLQSINKTKLLDEDKSMGLPFRYGVVQDVDLDIKSGLETTIDSGIIWRYEVYSDSAVSLKLLFKQFVIPPGAKLFVYNSDYSLIYGAFTSANVRPDSTFVIADFPGNSLIIEYYEPADAGFEGILEIDRISLGYKELGELMPTEDDSSDYIDVNCSEGMNWQLEKHAVCRYTFSQNKKSYLCSGALINNVNNDGTPYFLTANHCVSSSLVAASVVAYFNYETEGCGLKKKTYQTLSGAILLTTGDDSDFTLLKFFSTPPASYQPYYAGWDLTDSAASTTCIHHPEGLLKKISLDNDPPSTYSKTLSWDEGGTTPAYTHWLVYFDKGTTGGGSSGSPLFNENHRIIGQLHGGGDEDEYFGKVNYSWEHSNTSSDRTGTGKTYSNLSYYLEGDSDLTYLNGYAPSSNLPEAVFSKDYEYVCLKSPVQFTDHSVFNPSEWKWKFSPSTVTFLDSTTENSQNPVVSFDEANAYEVQLFVKNEAGEDSVTYSPAVYSGATIAVSYESNVDSGICLLDLDSLVITASGADSYHWELDDDYFTLNDPDSSQVIVKQNQAYSLDSTAIVSGFVVGKQGSCVDTCRFSYEFLLPYNDNIANAKLIEAGENGPFTNECASVEEKEPVPSTGSCTSQTGWCDEYGTGEDIVEHSVWFCFYGPETGAVSIEANGMDGQIALYEADSYSAILNGEYNILAANDDISSTDSNSKITNTTVTPGKMYWLQFDGSGGGTEGDFHIVLNEEVRVSVNSLITSNEDQLIFYPQPASGYLTISSTDFVANSTVQVKIYTLTGTLVYSGDLAVQQNAVTVSLKNTWPDGIYFVSVADNDFVATGKFIRGE